MKIKYRIIHESGIYFIEQKTGLRSWEPVSEPYKTEREAFDWLVEIAREVLESRNKPEVVGNYIIDDHGLRDDESISIYYPLDKPPVPKPSK